MNGVLKIGLALIFSFNILAAFSCRNSEKMLYPSGNNTLENARENILLIQDRLKDQDSLQPRDYGNLLIAYCRRYLSLGGDSIPDLEDFLEGNYTPKAAGYAFVSLANNEIQSPFAEMLKTRMEGQNEKEKALFHHARLVYETGKIWKQPEKSRDDWKQIVDLMEEAILIQRTVLYNDALLTAYKELELHNEIFTFSAYRYIDEGEDSGITIKDVKDAFLKVDGAVMSFSEAYEAVFTMVLDDYHKGMKALPELQLEKELFSDGISGEDFVIDYVDSASPFLGKSLVVSIFSVGCPHCIDELQALSEIAEEFRNSTVIVGIHKVEENHKEQMLLDVIPIKVFAKKNNIRIPLLLDEGSVIFKELNINAVPYTLLFDKEGRLVQRINIVGDAHAADKIRFYLKKTFSL